MNVEASQLAWFKSSYSGNEGGECIEIAATPSTIHIRDSKDQNGPQLTTTPTSWTAFLALAATL
ncbi:DUF397 domain-containing protein [Kitasatospora kifunensis]|uniref:DUF397 domain-containing protein n=1 Tax=Kitasatospora kifunensis TaxID=58351 RepID=A0A7W7VXJ5_KITKI|nr:DUF397 domain-containing protein [Kitasatospora kifunensis]MBB4926023.1 hypothetical protein [Kitasatospora kifunensis]